MRLIIVFGVSDLSGFIKLPPILIVTLRRTSFSKTSIFSTSLRIRSATEKSEGGLHSERRMTNSSPPKRATQSSSRTEWRSVFARAARTLSPAR